MKPFQSLEADRLTAPDLQAALHERGYALVRGILPVSAVGAVLADVTSVLANAGWLRQGPGRGHRLPAPGASFGDPDPIFKAVYQQVFNLESFHSLAHAPALRSAMQMLTGPEVLIHPKPIGRLIFPNCERLVVRPHQDYEFMQGDPEFYTVWIPLHNCSTEQGSLRIARGSHRRGVLTHSRDGLHVPELPTGSIPESDWVSGSVLAGDVLIFHSCTIHAANPNTSSSMRLSIDCRFQDARRQLHPSNLVFAGESGKSWEKTYSGWRSSALQYYWKSLPLALKPSRAELEELATCAETQKQRDRYARMAAQLV